MPTSAPSLTTAYAPPSQAVGRVADILPDGYFIVEHHQRGWQCRLAAGCLLQPQWGDEVLIAGDGARLWLLAVLTRADPALPCRLSATGSLHIAAATLTFEGREQLAISAPQLAIDAERGRCRIKDMHYQGKKLSAWLASACVTGDRLESVWRTVVQISDRLLRKVARSEHARVGQLDIQAEDYARVHAKSLLMTSDAITKIDSKQIHMG